jgi:hypothetical protein
MNQDLEPYRSLDQVDACFDSGDYDEATRLLLSSVDIVVPTRLHLNSLESAMTLTLLERAGRIRNKYPRNATVSFFLGRLIFSHGSPKAAIPLLSDALTFAHDLSLEIITRRYRFMCALRENLPELLHEELVFASNLGSESEIRSAIIENIAVAISETSNVQCIPTLQHLSKNDHLRLRLPRIAELIGLKAAELLIVNEARTDEWF